MQVKKLETVQYKFLRYAAFKIGSPLNFDENNYTNIATLLNLESIKSLHTYNIYFVRKVESNLINCGNVSGIFEARLIIYNLRAYRVLKKENSPRNSFRYSTVPRLKRV